MTKNKDKAKVIVQVEDRPAIELTPAQGARARNVTLSTVKRLEKRMGARVWDGVIYNRDGISNPTLTILNNKVGREIREILYLQSDDSTSHPELDGEQTSFPAARIADLDELMRVTRQLDTLKSHADKLAEACKSIAKLSEGWTSEQMNYAIRKAQSALAAYESEVQ